MEHKRKTSPEHFDDDQPLDEVERVFAEYVERLQSGEKITPWEIERDHPTLATELMEHLDLYQSALGERAGTPRALGDYQIRREIARGGMGIVYDAWQNSMDRQVALKVLPIGVAADSKAYTRFLREARVAGKLSHPHIVSVYGFGVESDTPYYSMEYVHGETLAQILSRRRSPAGKGDPKRTLLDSDEIDLAYFARLAKEFAHVADALQHAHSRGIIHRDIKPSNLILSEDSHLRILDFGLARLEGELSLTASGDFVGTPLYVSPEQARARKLAIDHRTDIYSLGATMYEVLTQRPPFRGKDPADTLSQIIDREPEPPRKVDPRVPTALETIVLKCLHKDPGDRYGTAEALAQDLRRFARGDPVEARPQPTWQKLQGLARRHRASLLALGAILVVGCIAAGVSSAYIMRKQGELRERTRNEVTSLLDEARGLWTRALLEEALRRAQFAAERARAVVEAPLRAQADDLLNRLREASQDRAMVARLEELPVPSASGFDLLERGRIDAEYREAFRECGIDVEHLGTELIAEQIQQRGIALELALALDAWALLRRMADGTGPDLEARRRLFRIASAVDPDPWRNRWRRAVLAEDFEELKTLAAEVDVTRAADRSVTYLAACLFFAREEEAALSLLRRAQRAAPGSYWLNHWLGLALGKTGVHSEGRGYLRAALAGNTTSFRARRDLGQTFVRLQNYEAAVSAYTEAIRLKPRYRMTYDSGPSALLPLLQSRERSEFGEALADLTEVLADLLSSGFADDSLIRRTFVAAWCLEPSPANAHQVLTIARSEVERTSRRDAEALALLAQVEHAGGYRDKAVLLLEEALRLRGASLWKAARLLENYREELRPNLPSYASIDAALELPEASGRKLIDDFRQWADAESARARITYLDGRMLEIGERYGEAARKFREVLAFDRGQPEPFLHLARSLRAAGDPTAAEKELRELLARGKLSAHAEMPAELWNLWLAISFDNLARPPSEILSLLPAPRTDMSPVSESRRPQVTDYARDVRWLLERLESGHAIRINCGGERHVSRDGKIWGRDRFFTGGEAFRNGNATFSDEVAGTEDDALYVSVRYSRETGAGYAVPLPPGDYRVTLHFAEYAYPRRLPGFRVVDVLLEGRPELEGHDTWAHVGGAAADFHTRPTKVEDGLLEIELVGRKAVPHIEAIEIEPVPDS